MRSFLWILLFLVGLTGVLIPVVYLYTAAQLPQLESEYDLQTHLRNTIEGERMSTRAGRADDEKRSNDWQKPEFAKMPHDLIALYISQLGCPNFFRTPREDGLRWAWRMMSGLWGAQLEGDGWCEKYFASRLANNLGVKGKLQLTVGAHKIHAFLAKDELVAYDFASMRFNRGIVGIDDAAWELYRKKLQDMNLAELAEFTLALPMHGYFADLQTCRNASLIKQNRNFILEALGRQGLVAPDKVKDAVKAPVACLNVP